METKKVEHTPVPWEVDYEGPCRLAIIAPNSVERGEMIAFTNLQNVDGDIDEANAEFIVRACNAHDELVEVAKRALAELVDLSEMSITTQGGNYEAVSLATINQLEAALAKATNK